MPNPLPLGKRIMGMSGVKDSESEMEWERGLAVPGTGSVPSKSPGNS